MGVILSPIADNELVRTIQLFGANWYIAFFEWPISLLLLAVIGWCFARAAITSHRRRLALSHRPEE